MIFKQKLIALLLLKVWGVYLAKSKRDSLDSPLNNIKTGACFSLSMHCIPRRHLQCWQLFCKACYFLCRRKVSISEVVNEANTLLLEFCTSLYSKEKCTINLHLHCHLADCVKDFGPVYAFWLFAYERFNGIMGSFHTNGKSISVQLMERFLDMSAYIPSKWPSEYVNEFLPILEQFKYQQGSLLQNTVETAASDRNFVCNPLTPIHEIHECCWQSNEIQQLEKICQVELNSRDCRVLMVTKRTKRLLLNNCYLSCDPRKSIIFALRENTGSTLAQMHYFSECKCEVSLPETINKTMKVWVIAVTWYMACKVWYGSPSQVWSCVQRSEIDLIPITSFISTPRLLWENIWKHASNYCHTS